MVHARWIRVSREGRRNFTAETPRRGDFRMGWTIGVPAFQGRRGCFYEFHAGRPSSPRLRSEAPARQARPSPPGLSRRTPRGEGENYRGTAYPGRCPRLLSFAPLGLFRPGKLFLFSGFPGLRCASAQAITFRAFGPGDGGKCLWLGGSLALPKDAKTHVFSHGRRPFISIF
jgi:hypothetical protein